MNPTQPEPWYRHFWPWFIVGLLSVAVTASLMTVWIAFVNRDALVSDDWYEDGTAINQRLELDALATQHGVHATLSSRQSGEVELLELTLAGRDLGDVPWLSLDLSHPTQARLDRQVLLERVAEDRYRGRLAETPSGRWYATLRPFHLEEAGPAPSPWRLTHTLRLPLATPVSLGAVAAPFEAEVDPAGAPRERAG